jgi:uncharacterized phiE125 gp8 family phage protein
MFRAIKLKTPPANEPLEVSDIKSWLRVDGTDEDSLLQVSLEAARDKVESFLKRRLITQDWTVCFDKFASVLTIPLAPVQSVLEIRHRDLAGEWQTLDPAAWEAVTGSEPAAVCPVWGDTWPGCWPRPGAVEVDVRIGYGNNGSDVPPSILTAIRREAAGYFENRESTVMSGRPAELPAHFNDLLSYVFHY